MHSPSPSEHVTRRFERLSENETVTGLPLEGNKRPREPTKDTKDTLAIPQEKRRCFASDAKIRYGENEIRSTDRREATRRLTTEDRGTMAGKAVSSVALYSTESAFLKSNIWR